MGNNSVPKFIFRLSRFPVYRGSVLGRFYCTFKCTLLSLFSGSKLLRDFPANEGFISDDKDRPYVFNGVISGIFHCCSHILVLYS